MPTKAAAILGTVAPQTVVATYVEIKGIVPSAQIISIAKGEST